MTPNPDPKPILIDSALYIGDNGRVFCGAHAGAAARYTGRDLSGRAVVRLTERDDAAWKTALGRPLACESCFVTMDGSYLSRRGS